MYESRARTAQYVQGCKWTSTLIYFSVSAELHTFHVDYKVFVKPRGISRPSLHFFSAVHALQFGGPIRPSGPALQSVKLFPYLGLHPNDRVHLASIFSG
jgi:hypothetical protein